MRNYLRFMRDHFVENNPELAELFQEEMEFDEAVRDDVYKQNFYFRDNLQIPFVSNPLSSRKVQDAIIDFTGKFIDDHHTQLSTSGPVYMFTFGEKEANFFYSTFNIGPDQIKQFYDVMVQEAYYGKISKFFTGWVYNAPHKILITSILMEAVQKGYEDIITCCEYIWAFCEYPTIYREFWKTGVKEDVMNYTIEHLNNKSKIKSMNNLQELLKYDAHAAVSFFTEELKIGADNTYMDLMQRMNNQIKSKIRNIANAYYDNVEKNATQHNNVSTFDDGEIADQEGVTTNIAQVVDKTTNKFATGEINKSMIRVAADHSKVDKDNLAGYIAQINGSKNNRINKIIENIITVYFSKNPTSMSVGSGEFINFGLSLYRSIGTSKDPLLKEIRDILNIWMFDIIDIRSQYQREATIISYTRAIFNYTIFMIAHYN